MKLVNCVLSQGRYFPKLNSSLLLLLKPSSKSLVRSSALNRTCEKRLAQLSGRNVSLYNASKQGLSESAFSGCLEKVGVDSLLGKSGSGHRLLTLTGRSEATHHHVLTSRVNRSIDLQAGLPHGQLRGFRTTPQHHVPPVFWILIKPVAKLGAILSGRYF